MKKNCPLCPYEYLLFIEFICKQYADFAPVRLPSKPGWRSWSIHIFGGCAKLARERSFRICLADRTTIDIFPFRDQCGIHSSKFASGIYQ